MTIVLLSFLLLIACLVGILALMLAFGGASDPIPEKNSESKKTDDRRRDAPSRTYVARDGSSLVYSDYAVSSKQKNPIVVLLHGSSATSVSLDPLARYLSSQRYHVVCPDIRGHGNSGEHGRIGYVGQLEDDIVDLMSEFDSKRKAFLVGFSSGGGLALRFAGSINQDIFDAYIFLAPFISHEASTYRDEKGTTEVGVPRFIALMILNRVGITIFNDLTVVKFLPEITDKYEPTTDYSFALMVNYRPSMDYIKNISSVNQPISVLVGSEDQVFHANEFSSVFDRAGKRDVVEIASGLDHEGVIFESQSHEWIARRLGKLYARE